MLMLNRKTLVRVTCPCGESLGSWNDNADWGKGYGKRAVRNMPAWRVWLWELRHARHTA